MSKKHVVMWLLVGWAVAYVFPPQRIVGYFKRGSGS